MNKNGSCLRRARQTHLKIAKLNATRLAMHRTNLHIYAQVFSENDIKVLISALTAEVKTRKELNGSGDSTAAVTLVGKRIAEKARAADIKTMAFDRSGFHYHGRVKTLAGTAREAGLKF